MNCKNCQYGPYYNAMSDICDGCMHDPNTGWSGFYDHRVGKRFSSTEEQDDYYKKRYDEDDEDF
jgi:hypothetical protein